VARSFDFHYTGVISIGIAVVLNVPAFTGGDNAVAVDVIVGVLVKLGVIRVLVVYIVDVFRTEMENRGSGVINNECENNLLGVVARLVSGIILEQVSGTFAEINVSSVNNLGNEDGLAQLVDFENTGGYRDFVVYEIPSTSDGEVASVVVVYTSCALFGPILTGPDRNAFGRTILGHFSVLHSSMVDVVTLLVMLTVDGLGVVNVDTTTYRT
jgi:hypothetical protein